MYGSYHCDGTAYESTDTVNNQLRDTYFDAPRVI